MLSHFSVKNYKCLADVSLPLTPIHVLIGQNDTGKTSLLEAIRAIGVFAGLGSHGRTPSGETRVVVHDRFQIIRSAFPGDWTATELLTRQSGDSALWLRMNSDRNQSRREEWTFSCAISFAPDAQGLDYRFGADIADLPATPRVELLRLRPVMMALPSALQTTAQDGLYEDGFGLPTLLDAIKDYDGGRFEAVQQTLNRYLPRYRRVRLENAAGWSRSTQHVGPPTTARNGAVGKQVLLVTDSGDIRLQQASDGAILLLGFLALMYSPKPPNVLLIEEPENGIHPKRLIEVAKLLRQFVEREENAPQIIMTTHSPYLLSQFQPEEVTLMRRQPDGSAKAFPLRDAPHIRERMGDEFYLGELWYNLDEEELLK